MTTGRWLTFVVSGSPDGSKPYQGHQSLKARRTTYGNPRSPLNQHEFQYRRPITHP